MRGRVVRILIAWANDASANLGVRALGQGSVDLLSQVWPDADFTFMNYGQRPSQVPWPVRSLLKERVFGSLGMMRWLRGFDLVWDTRSGDSFADIYGLARHSTMSLIHDFATQAGVPVVLAPQTIGPFGSRRGTMLARRNLRRSALVFARDPKSAEAAHSLGRDVDATTSDLVFGIAQPTVTTERDVLLNVSGLLWDENPHVDAGQYRASIRRIIDELLASGRAVTLLPHVLQSGNAKDNDEPVTHALAAEYDGRIDVHVPKDLHDARAAIAGAKLVIGARMHACLNALSTGTPAIAMAYSRKFAPLMKSVDWKAVVSITEPGDHAEAVLAFARDADLPTEAKEAQRKGQSLLEPVIEQLRQLR